MPAKYSIQFLDFTDTPWSQPRLRHQANNSDIIPSLHFTYGDTMFQTGYVTWPLSLNRNHELSNLDGTTKDVDSQRLNQSSEVSLIILGR